MSLKYTLESLEGLPEEVAKFYTKKNGKFVLDVDETEAGKTIDKVRQERDEAIKALKEREKAEADARSAAERVAMEQKGDYEKLKASLEADRAQLVKERDAAVAAHKDALVTSALAAAISEHKGSPHLAKLLRDQLEGVIADGESKVLVKGKPEMSPSDFVKSLKADPAYGQLFEGSGASGGGAPVGGGQGSAAEAQYFDPKNPNYSYTKQMEIAKSSPAVFESLRAQFPSQE